jgi:hypothetical protein
VARSLGKPLLPFGHSFILSFILSTSGIVVVLLAEVP